MKKIKYIIKMIFLVILIILAAFGMVVMGPVTFPKVFSREKNKDDKTEQIEEEKDQEEMAQLS